MPEIWLGYAWDLQDMCLIYTLDMLWDVLKTFLWFAKNLPEISSEMLVICLGYNWYVPEMCKICSFDTPTWGTYKICLIYGWYLPDICLVYVLYLPGGWDLPKISKICLKYVWDTHGIYLTFVSNMLQICLRYVWDMPEIWQRIDWDFYGICLRFP